MWNTKAHKRAVKEGYRSGLESAVSKELTSQGVAFEYEPAHLKVEYLVPVKKRRYLPDFVLGNGIIIETKGRFTSADRQKHLMIHEQHPELDIRFVFSNPNTKLTKTSPTTYAAWCDKYGFEWSHRHVPMAWIAEEPRGYVQPTKKGSKDDSKAIRFKLPVNGPQHQPR